MSVTEDLFVFDLSSFFMLSSRLHYNIFYYLYLMENSCSAVKTVEQAVPGLPCVRDLWSR